MLRQVSFGPISWLMVGEIFPLAVRGQATALATLTNFGSNFGVRHRLACGRLLLDGVCNMPRCYPQSELLRLTYLSSKLRSRT